MSCPIMNLFAKCCCGGGKICLYCIQLTVVTVGIAFGALVAWKPKQVINAQIAVYRLFNWKMEPISMEKEIWNTRAMGLLLLAMGVVALVCVLVS